jgi:predicted nucleotidyltransferase
VLFSYIAIYLLACFVALFYCRLEHVFLGEEAMTKGELVDKLKAHKDDLRRMGVASLTLFGSSARGETREGSDIDLLVEFDRTIGVFHFFRVQHLLEEILGVPKVDLVQKGAVHPALRDRIIAEAIDVA